MSLADTKRRAARQSYPLRGQMATPVATPAPAPKPEYPERKIILIEKDGPRATFPPAWLLAGRTRFPIKGSREAEIALEEAWRQWRQERGKS